MKKYAVIDTRNRLYKVFDKCKEALSCASSMNDDAKDGIFYNVELIDYEHEHTIYVVFGEQALSAYDDGIDELRKQLIEDPHIGAVLKASFATEEEKKAYIRGVEDSQDWYGYAIVRDWEVEKISDLVSNGDEERSCIEVVLEYLDKYDGNLYSADIKLNLNIFNHLVEVESIYVKNQCQAFVHVGCKEFEGDFDIESLSDDNINHIQNTLYSYMKKQEK